MHSFTIDERIYTPFFCSCIHGIQKAISVTIVSDTRDPWIPRWRYMDARIIPLCPEWTHPSGSAIRHLPLLMNNDGGGRAVVTQNPWWQIAR